MNRPHPTEQLLILIITGCFVLQPISTDLYLASLPHLVSEFGVSMVIVQQTLSFFTIGFGVTQLISGPLSDRFGRKPMVLAGLATYFIASLICARAGDIYILISGRFLQAIGCCTAIVACRAIIRDCYSPSEGAQRIARASNYMGLAVFTGPIVGALLQDIAGWRAAFYLHTLLSLAVLVFAWRMLQESNRPTNPQAITPLTLSRSYLELCRARAFWRYALPGCLSYGTIFVFISGASFGFIKILGVSTIHYGYCFSLGCAGYLAGTYLCRKLLPKLGMEKVITMGSRSMLLSGFSFLVCTFSGIEHWMLLVLFQFGSMFSHGLIFPTTQAGSVAPFPQKAGTAAGLFGAVSVLGTLLVTTLIGINLKATLSPMAILAFVMSLALFLSVRLNRPGN